MEAIRGGIFGSGVKGGGRTIGILKLFVFKPRCSGQCGLLSMMTKVAIFTFPLLGYQTNIIKIQMYITSERRPLLEVI